jgi:hypothetical protein
MESFFPPGIRSIVPAYERHEQHDLQNEHQRRQQPSGEIGQGRQNGHERDPLGKMPILPPEQKRPAIRVHRQSAPDASGIRNQQEISDSPSGLSVKLHWEGVCIPSPMATVETPAVRKGSRPPHRLEGRGFKPELVLR